MRRMKTRAVLLALLMATVVLGCGKESARPALTLSQMPDVDVNQVMAHTRALSSDEFEGRLPGTKGEELTVAYLIDQFKAMGLEPGNPNGSWTQPVPLVGLTPEFPGPLVVSKRGTSRTFRVHDDFVPFSLQVTDDIKIDRSDIV